MAWGFFKILLKYMGSRAMTRLAPRLIFFQYYDRIAMEIQEQKKKYRVNYFKTTTGLRFFHISQKKSQQKVGISSVLSDRNDDANIVSIIDVHSQPEFSDSTTVSSRYQYNERDQDFQFIVQAQPISMQKD